MPTHGRKYKKLNFVSALIDTEMVCMMEYDCSTTSELFNGWFESVLCPALPKDCVVILDNAAFHSKTKLKEIADKFNIRIIWLPPYSPDKNPIEKCWANLKNWLRLWAKNYSTIQDAITDFFKRK